MNRKIVLGVLEYFGMNAIQQQRPERLVDTLEVSDPFIPTTIRATESTSKMNVSSPRKADSKRRSQQPQWESPIVSPSMGRVAGEEALRHSKDFDAHTRLARHLPPREKRNVTKLRWSDLEIGELLGEGNFSHVYEVRLIYRDDLPDTDTVTTGNETIQEDIWNTTAADWRNPRVEEADIWDLVSVADEDDSDSTQTEDEGRIMGLREMKVRERVYALKHLHPRVTKKQKKFTASAIDLVLEAKLLSYLNHPNIVKLFGVTEGSVNKVFSDQGYFLLLDRLHETLDDRILEWTQKEAIAVARVALPSPTPHKHSSKNRRSSSSSRNKESATVAEPDLCEREREKLVCERIGSVVIDIARGMEYLHLHRIIFRDLKVSVSVCGVLNSLFTRLSPYSRLMSAVERGIYKIESGQNI